MESYDRWWRRTIVFAGGANGVGLDPNTPLRSVTEGNHLLDGICLLLWTLGKLERDKDRQKQIVKHEFQQHREDRSVHLCGWRVPRQ